MQIKNKYYPYPVIAYGNDSYEEREFITDANYTQDAHSIIFHLEATLNDAVILNLVKQGMVKYAHHIECQQTCYRKLVLTDSPEVDFKVHESRINGLVQICSFLMASINIPNYSNPAFSKDYRGFKFNIEQGCVLAIGNQVNMNVSKENDEIASTSSIFSIRKDHTPEADKLQVNTTGQKIVVLIPEKTCNQYYAISGQALFVSVLHAMVIQPALMQVLYELKEAAQRDVLYEYDSLRWYRSLKKTSEKLGIKFDEDALKSMDVFCIAQKFLDSPVVKAFAAICSGDGGADD